MRLNCPFCGTRDLREFACIGGDPLPRPQADAPAAEWDAYLHLRENPAGPSRELWYHEGGCGAWLRVSRDTLTHAIAAVEPLAPPAPDAPDMPAAARKPRKRKGAGDVA